MGLVKSMPSILELKCLLVCVGGRRGRNILSGECWVQRLAGERANLHRWEGTSFDLKCADLNSLSLGLSGHFASFLIRELEVRVREVREEC